jgi:hypothetical protein
VRRRLGRPVVVFSLFVPVAGVLAYVAGCVPLWTPPPRAKDSAAAQVACAYEAGTLAEGEACVCAVRARYPEGPQCEGGVK